MKLSTELAELAAQISNDFPEKAECVNMDSPAEVLFIAREIVSQCKLAWDFLVQLNKQMEEAK